MSSFIQDPVLVIQDRDPKSVIWQIENAYWNVRYINNGDVIENQIKSGKINTRKIRKEEAESIRKDVKRLSLMKENLEMDSYTVRKQFESTIVRK